MESYLNVTSDLDFVHLLIAFQQDLSRKFQVVQIYRLHWLSNTDLTGRRRHADMREDGKTIYPSPRVNYRTNSTKSERKETRYTVFPVYTF